MPWRLVFVAFLISSGCAGRPAAAAEPNQAPRPNVLFIAVDDLNDWIGCLGGNPQAQTPNIDRLAARGTVFSRAYCAAPLCNPSRTALMSGLRPSTTGVYGNDTDWRPIIAAKQTPTLGAHFRTHGYYTAGAGKIYHGSFPASDDWDDYGRHGGKNLAPPKDASRGVGGITFAPVVGSDDEMVDYHTVSYCIEQLQKPHDRPLFLACGLHKPHMPWYVPQKYYDQFPLASIQLPKMLETDLDDVPEPGRKLAGPDGDHQRILESGRWKEAVQGYLAAHAFADAQIGRLLAAFDKSAYRDNTIIIFWGDHGWSLGEKLSWRKNTLWEEATRAPLIVVAPGVTRAGSASSRTVDFMSIYPTLVELCGLPVPAHLEGPSLVPLLKNPGAPWDRPAITTCHGPGNHAVRSEGWRYIRYADGTEELYDETADPLEWKNLAGDARYASTKSELARWLPAASTADASTPASKSEKRQAKRAKRAKE